MVRILHCMLTVCAPFCVVDVRLVAQFATYSESGFASDRTWACQSGRHMTIRAACALAVSVGMCAGGSVDGCWKSPQAGSSNV